MKTNSRSRNPLNPKAPFRWGFMDIIPSTAPKILISDTTLSNYLSIVDAYSKIQKVCGMDIITTEEVMDNLYMFQYILGKIEKIGW